MKFEKFLNFISASEAEAQSIWYLLSGLNQRAIVDGDPVEYGSWRWTAGELSRFFNTTSYMEYYCGGPGDFIEELKEKFEAKGIILVPIGSDYP